MNAIAGYIRNQVCKLGLSARVTDASPRYDHLGRNWLIIAFSDGARRWIEFER